MDEDLENINLLPDELRKEEEKIRQAPKEKIPVEFHVPQKVEAKSLPQPLAPKKEIKLPKLDLEPEPKILPEKSISNKPSFWQTLFKKKKHFQEDTPQNIIKNNLNNSLPKIDGILHEELVLDDMDVNLIPEGTYLLPSKKMYIQIGIFALIGIFFGMLIYLGLVAYDITIKKQADTITANVAEGEKVLIEFEQTKQEAEFLSQKLDVVNALLKVHIYWTQAFNILERLTINDVYYSNISATADGLITLSANTTSYTNVARQYKVLQEAPEVASVGVTGATGSNIGESITFSITLELMPDLFYSK